MVIVADDNGDACLLFRLQERVYPQANHSCAAIVILRVVLDPVYLANEYSSFVYAIKQAI